MKKPLIISDKNFKSETIKKQILSIFKKKEILKKNTVIVIGGDGFMLKTLKKNICVYVYWMIYLLYNYRLFINSIYIIIDNNVKNVNVSFHPQHVLERFFLRDCLKKI